MDLATFAKQNTGTVTNSLQNFSNENVNDNSLASFAASQKQTGGFKQTALNDLRWVGKQLMKPVNAVGTAFLQGRLAAEQKSTEPLKQIPSKVGEVLTGKSETGFIDFYKQSMPNHPVAATILGTVASMVLDPLNFSGGILTKGVGLAGKGLEKIPGVEKLAQGAKTLFSTSSGNKAFDIMIDKYKSLGDFRKANLLEDARNVQKIVSKLPKGDIIKVSNYVEKGIKSTPEINSLGEKLKNTYQGWKSLEKELGVKGGELEQYIPHIKTETPLIDKIKNFISPTREFSGKLGGAEKSRTILKFVSKDGEELVGKIDNLGLKETTKGFVNKSGKIFQATQASIDEVAQAFGKKFFEENPAIQMAYRGLAHVKATTGKEFFNAAKTFATKEGIEVGASELKGLKFAPEIAKSIDKYYKGLQPEELKVITRTFNAVQNWWKGQVLIAPSYHIRNMVSNIWSNFLAGVKNPISYIKAGMIQAGKGKDLKIAGMTADDLIKLAKERGVVNQGWYAADIPSAVESGIKSTWKEGINPLSQQNYGFKLNKAVGSAFENNARLAHFIEKLEGGSSVNDAVMSVKKYLFDYGDLTDFEKNVMKKILPFYTWTRKNIPLQLGALVEQPAKFSGIEKVVRGIENISMGNAQPANEKYLADYIKNNTPMRISYNPQEKTYYYFLLGNWLPAYQAVDFLSQSLYNIMAMVTPIIKTPLELSSNKSTFFRNTLGDNQLIENYPGESTNFLGFNMPKKTALVLQNIRVLNELDKLNPGKIFGGKSGEKSIQSKLNVPAVNLPVVGDISPATSKYGKTMPAPNTKERIAGLLFGKLQAYKPSFSKSQYDWETQQRINEFQQAIKAASRQGDTKKVNLLNQQLRDFVKQRQ